MNELLTVDLRDVAVDGYPNMDALTGRVAFIFDGCVVSGWPLYELGEDGFRTWEADSDVGRTGAFAGVRKWLVFPEPIHQIERRA